VTASTIWEKIARSILLDFLYESFLILDYIFLCVTQCRLILQIVSDLRFLFEVMIAYGTLLSSTCVNGLYVLQYYNNKT
jgi:hypothetical protein